MIKINNYDLLFWGEYKGKPQLVVGSLKNGEPEVDDKGEYKPQIIQKKVKSGTITLPMTINFESKDDAIQGLKLMIAELESPF